MKRERGIPAIMVCLAVAWASPAAADVVTDWNQTILATAGAAAPAGLVATLTSIIDVAMAHLAMHDAAQAYDKRFTRYVESDRLGRGRAPWLSRERPTTCWLSAFRSRQAVSYDLQQLRGRTGAAAFCIGHHSPALRLAPTRRRNVLASSRRRRELSADVSAVCQRHGPQANGVPIPEHWEWWRLGPAPFDLSRSTAVQRRCQPDDTGDDRAPNIPRPYFEVKAFGVCYRLRAYSRARRDCPNVPGSIPCSIQPAAPAKFELAHMPE